MISTTHNSSSYSRLSFQLLKSKNIVWKQIFEQLQIFEQIFEQFLNNQQCLINLFEREKEGNMRYSERLINIWSVSLVNDLRGG